MRKAILINLLIGFFVSSMFYLFAGIMGALKVPSAQPEATNFLMTMLVLSISATVLAPLGFRLRSSPRLSILLVAFAQEYVTAFMYDGEVSQLLAPLAKLATVWPFAIGVAAASLFVFVRLSKRRWSMPPVSGLPVVGRCLAGVALVLLSSGCVVGPLVLNESARTLGEGNQEFVGGYGSAGYALKYSVGISENWDLGVQWESLSFGIRAKHTFLGNKDGFSLAAAGGVGVSSGGSHIYADLIASSLNGKWEPYGALRVVHATVDGVSSSKGGESYFTPKAGASYDYAQIIGGARYWLDERRILSFEASSPLSDLGAGLIVGAAFGYRF